MAVHTQICMSGGTRELISWMGYCKAVEGEQRPRSPEKGVDQTN